MRFDAKQLREMSNSVRAFALHALRSARSGHAGIVLSAADIVTIIYANFLRRGQDKFVLSAGHGSALLYSVLKLAGYDIGDLESFRKIGGLPGHPEFGIDGVFATTGPLGQGVGNAVGMALAAKINSSDERVYCLCSDGDLSEGVAAEAVTFAGHYGLNNLVLLWDDNGVTIDGAAVIDADMSVRMVAAGWDVMTVNGDCFGELQRALMRAARAKKPTFIQCKNIIGRDSSVAGLPAAHGLALKDAELMRLINKFISPLGEELWASVAADAPAKYVMNPLDVDTDSIPVPWSATDISTRELSGMYLGQLMLAGARLIVGSADLAGSTNVKTASHRDILPGDFNGNFINYGVRESAMGAIMNGLAASGMRAVGSTFLVFSDYMRPSIRLAALSGLPVVYVFTHDSIAVGEDGPTHQPIEQLPSLRLMPGLDVFRPCNGVEVASAWRAALRSRARPSCIVLSRQKFRQIPTPPAADVARGAYVICPAKSKRVRITLIATGSEVPLAVDVAHKLGKDVQVVSMCCVERFRRQSDEYKSEMLRGNVVAIEAAATAPWFEFADAVVGINGFGLSGAGAEVYNRFGFNADIIARDIAKKFK